VRRFALAALALLAIGCQTATAQPPAVESIPADAVRVVADHMQFETAQVEAPAGRSFVLVFENREGVPHNVSLRDAAGGSVFATEFFSGPGTRSYEVSALGAAGYTFVCDLHPDMTGRLTAVEGGI
jgi:plastocyanin